MSTSIRPATQTVYLHHSKAWTSSLMVAQEFDKRHKNILRAVNNLNCSAEFNRLNFEPVKYIDEKGEERPMVEMTFNGFIFLVMGFTGEKAAMVKEAYILEFDRMRSALMRQKDPDWQSVRQQGTQARLFESDAIAEFVEYAREQGSTHAERYYATITRETYKALFTVQTESMKRIRTLLTQTQLTNLEVAERIVCRAIREGISSALPYKGNGGIYQHTMDTLKTYASLLERTVVPMRKQLT
jgi:Rha family phage regulatory protein